LRIASLGGVGGVVAECYILINSGLKSIPPNRQPRQYIFIYRQNAIFAYTLKRDIILYIAKGQFIR
jgi:hypothetical protein